MRNALLRGVLPAIAALVAVPAVVQAQHTFDDDVAFLRQRLEVVVLGEEKGARVAVVPAWQGRVDDLDHRRRRRARATAGSTASSSRRASCCRT